MDERVKELLRELLAVEETYEIFIVWKCKTLQNCKWLMGTTLPDRLYYEVTYNGDKQELYIDEYDKTRNVVIGKPFEGL